MKVGIITTPNIKGQIVIPKEIRDTLKIGVNVPLNLVVRGGGIYIYPVEEVVSKVESESSYLEILKKTQGSWSGDGWEKTERKRKRIELQESRKRKKQW